VNKFLSFSAKQPRKTFVHFIGDCSSLLLPRRQALSQIQLLSDMYDI